MYLYFHVDTEAIFSIIVKKAFWLAEIEFPLTEILTLPLFTKRCVPCTVLVLQLDD